MIKIIECPRDAMQGIKEFIPTEKKIRYINSLLKVGFDTLDFGSFVSPKTIPQMRDTAEVLKGLNLHESTSKLLAIVANQRGAEDACAFDEVSYLGFPFSISETFQQRNTHSSIAESLQRVEEIQVLCEKKCKQLVIYISMAFGNPYNEAWNSGIVMHWVKQIAERGIQIIALADTTGISNPTSIKHLFSTIIPEFPDIEIGAHLHTTPDTWMEKVEAAYASGCKRFDSALKGLGGCPMAKDDLTGNMPTENLIGFFAEKGKETGLNKDMFNASLKLSSEIFPG